MGDIDSYSNSELDITRDSKLGCSVESLLEGWCESYASKLALRASLRYTGEDDQWQTKRRSLRDRNKYVYNRELFSDVRFLVGRGEKTSIPAHRYVLAISSPVFSSLFYAYGALQAEIATREQVNLFLFNISGYGALSSSFVPFSKIRGILDPPHAPPSQKNKKKSKRTRRLTNSRKTKILLTAPVIF